jgi:PhoH-like ATPase
MALDQGRRQRGRGTGNCSTKLFVLDTNVLMHDPTSLFRFEEHDIFVPMMTLEELDNNKKGMSEVARNARQASRMLDEIVGGFEDASDGHPADRASSELATGRLFLQTEPSTAPAGHPAHRQGRQPDHRRGDAPAQKHPKRR